MLLHIFNSSKKQISFLAKSGITLLILVGFSSLARRYLQIDNWALNVFGARDNPYLNFCSRISYIMGDTHIAGTVVAISLIGMIWLKYYKEAIAFAFATSGILILVDEILKPFFDRNRPPKPRLVEDVSRHSFPSGHAAGNVVLYFYLAFIVATKYPHLKVYVYSIATIIVIAIGFASVYTKAHWLTDVLAGYVFGYLWLMVSLYLLKFLERK